MLLARGGAGGFLPAIFTFGGERETFNFADPLNYRNVDRDVWRFGPTVCRPVSTCTSYVPPTGLRRAQW